jgi:phage/plasmid-like protein (TIGR03299 family)
MSALVETMFHLGAMPWHQDSTKLDKPPTSKEAIVEAGLNWRILTAPIYMQTPGSEIVANAYTQVPEGQVVIRETDKKVLGVVGPRWTPVQNQDAFNFFDPLVQDGLAVYHTAGSLREGRTIWILAQIGEERNVIGEDNIGQFLLLSVGHDGTRGIHLLPTPIRVVCANTEGMAFNQAESEGTMLKYAHTTNVVRRLEETREFIRPFLANFDHTVEVFKLLAKAQVVRVEVDAYLQGIFPDPTGTEEKPANTTFAENVRAVVQAKFEGDLLGYDAIPRQFQRTYWTLYNAVTEYIDHERGGDKHRLNSLWMGSGKQIKDRALEMAMVTLK